MTARKKPAKLLPCPCGAQAIMDRIGCNRGYWVRCKNRNAFGVGGVRSCMFSLFWVGSRTNAVAAWNALPRGAARLRRKINPSTGCYCQTLAHRLCGDGCDKCQPKQRRRAKAGKGARRD